MITIEEIQTALDALAAQMLEKCIAQPDAKVWLAPGSRPSLVIWARYETAPFDNDHVKFFTGDTLAKCFAAARAYIAALPSPEEIVTNTYLTKVAAAVGYATEHSIADEYVAPLRGVSCAMTDNLLTVTK